MVKHVFSHDKSRNRLYGQGKQTRVKCVRRRTRLSNMVCPTPAWLCCRKVPVYNTIIPELWLLRQLPSQSRRPPGTFGHFRRCRTQPSRGFELESQTICRFRWNPIYDKWNRVIRDIFNYRNFVTMLNKLKKLSNFQNQKFICNIGG